MELSRLIEAIEKYEKETPDLAAYDIELASYQDESKTKIDVAGINGFYSDEDEVYLLTIGNDLLEVPVENLDVGQFLNKLKSIASEISGSLEVSTIYKIKQLANGDVTWLSSNCWGTLCHHESKSLLVFWGANDS